MHTSQLFRVHTENRVLQRVKQIDFSDFHFKERFDIQEWIESTPDIMGEELLIVAKENSCFEGTKERPDLIALDKNGNIVIIELKRDDSGLTVDWQAQKYASYWSRFKAADIVEKYSEYLTTKKQAGSDQKELDAEQSILEFVDGGTLENINSRQRIILVSHRFAREVTSTVNWLIDKYKMDIRCIQLIPYFDSDKDAHYLQSFQILPVTPIDELIVTAASHAEEVARQTGPVRKNDEVTGFFEKLKDEIADSIEHDLMPDKTSRWAGVGEDFRYFHFWYSQPEVWDNWYCSYKIWLFNKDNDGKEMQNKFGVYLDISRKHLLTHGFTEEQIDKLIASLKTIKLDDFSFREEGDNFWLESIVENDRLSLKSKESLEQRLIPLIKATKNLVEGS